jgi:hypothetical protein
MLNLNATAAGVTYTLATIPLKIVPPCTPNVTFTPFITGNYDVGLGGYLNISITANNTAPCGANVTCSIVSGTTTINKCGGNPCTVSAHIPASSQSQLTMQMQFTTSDLGSSYVLVCTYDTTRVNVATITLPSETIPVTIYCNGKLMYNNTQIGLSRPGQAIPFVSTGTPTASSYGSICTASTYSGGTITYNIQINVASAPTNWTATAQLSLFNQTTSTSISGPRGTSTQQAALTMNVPAVQPGTYTGQITITLTYTYKGITYTYNYTIPVVARIYAPVIVGFVNATYTAYAGQQIQIPVAVCSQAPSNVIYKVVDNLGNAYTRTVTVSQGGCVTDYVTYNVVGISDIDAQYIQAYAEGLQDYLMMLQLKINVVDASLLTSTAATGKVKG